MSQTVAESSASYRKRRAAKIERYEATLRAIASGNNTAAAIAARAALNPEPTP